MADYRRWYVAGGSYFFTVVTQRRAKFLTTPLARDCLRRAMQECCQRWPFTTEGFVLLPDHVHSIWVLPRGDTAYSTRWAWIKKEFSKAWIAGGGSEQPVSESRQRHRGRGVWQRRFWEHVIRDEEDFERHLDYIHYNPVKHGLCESPKDWPHSTFHRWVERGIYSLSWGCRSQVSLGFKDLDTTAME